MGTLISLIQYIGGYRSGQGGGSACILYLYTPVAYLAPPPSQIMRSKAANDQILYKILNLTKKESSLSS